MKIIVKFLEFYQKTPDNTIYGAFSKTRLVSEKALIDVTAKEVMDILKMNSKKLDRVTGSHHEFIKDGCRSVSVPFHGNVDLGIPGRRILKQA